MVINNYDELLTSRIVTSFYYYNLGRILQYCSVYDDLKFRSECLRLVNRQYKSILERLDEIDKKSNLYNSIASLYKSVVNKIYNKTLNVENGELLSNVDKVKDLKQEKENAIFDRDLWGSSLKKLKNYVEKAGGIVDDNFFNKVVDVDYIRLFMKENKVSGF